METLPGYLTKYYWWAYVHPRAIWFFDRQWLINLILYGYYVTLRDGALAALGNDLPGRTLQISCCYGNLTPRVVERIARAGGELDLVDVVQGQLDNVRRKLPTDSPVHYLRMDSSALEMADATYDRVILFFLLHEQPQDNKEKTLREALRVLKPNGTLVIGDFGKIAWWHPFRPYLFFLGFLEPFARVVWKRELADILPEMRALNWKKTSYFGGLFQILAGTRA